MSVVWRIAFRNLQYHHRYQHGKQGHANTSYGDCIGTLTGITIPAPTIVEGDRRRFISRSPAVCRVPGRSIQPGYALYAP